MDACTQEGGEPQTHSSCWSTAAMVPGRTCKGGLNKWPLIEVFPGPSGNEALRRLKEKYRATDSCSARNPELPAARLRVSGRVGCAWWHVRTDGEAVREGGALPGTSWGWAQCRPECSGMN